MVSPANQAGCLPQCQVQGRFGAVNIELWSVASSVGNNLLENFSLHYLSRVLAAMLLLVLVKAFLRYVLRVVDSVLSSNETSFPIRLVDSNDFDIEKHGSIKSRIVQDEIECTHAAESSGFGSDTIVFWVVGRIRQFSVRHYYLSDLSLTHIDHGALQTFDHCARTQNRATVINVLVKGSTLWTALGLEGSTKVSNGVAAPVKDHCE